MMGFPFDGFLYVSEAYGRGLESLENEGSVFHTKKDKRLVAQCCFPQWLGAAPMAPLPSPWGNSARSGCRVCPSCPTQRS